jgi:hypothetical protein
LCFKFETSSGLPLDFFRFIIADKARAKDKYINRGVGVMRGGESLPHTLWSGGIRYLRRGKWIRDEMFVSGMGEYVCVGMCGGSAIGVKVDT